MKETKFSPSGIFLKTCETITNIEEKIFNVRKVIQQQNFPPNLRIGIILVVDETDKQMNHEELWATMLVDVKMTINPKTLETKIVKNRNGKNGEVR